MKQKDIVLKQQGEIPYFIFPKLEATGIVKHGFSTKLGGVSKGDFATMNFTVARGDEPEAVQENFRRMAEVLEMPKERMVLSYQTHTTNVLVCTEEEAGMGICKERPYTDVDGLITNVPKLPLVTFYADCVPLYFVDTVKRVIGLSHSGWRGTVHRMGRVTIEKMTEVYGSNPKDIVAAIGPSICQNCYEVSLDVAEAFRQEFAPSQWSELLMEKPNDKFQLNLWKANEIILREAGVPQKQIAITDVCTCCHPDLLYSHRAHGTKRGNLAAFLMLT